jgi:hypothetical protein
MMEELQVMMSDEDEDEGWSHFSEITIRKIAFRQGTQDQKGIFDPIDCIILSSCHSSLRRLKAQQ